MSNVVAEVGSTASTYLVLAKLAVGGMAEIFLARGASAAGLQRYVVLKRILRDRANDAELVAMFMDEARLAAQLQHPNVAQVYDIGKLGDSYFFTMEYVHGETVRGLMHKVTELGRRVPISVVLSVIAGAAAGLHHAHERRGVDGKPLGIVHRDVSPSNLMVSYEGGVKVVDFGVAKAETRAIETRSGTVKGKISYLSPEQCRGTDADRRSDLFSLGIVMWEMLVGDRLYRRGSDFETMTAIVTENVPPPSQMRSDVPHELDELTLRLLAKRPADRLQTADDVVEAIEQLASLLGLQLSPNALGRYLREVFGTRKEPWLELDVTEADGVTVIGEPVLASPVPTSSSTPSIDEQLEGLEDLSVHVPYSESSAPIRPTKAYRSQDRDQSALGAPTDARVTAPMRATPGSQPMPQLRAPTAPVAPAPSAPFVAPLAPVSGTFVPPQPSLQMPPMMAPPEPPSRGRARSIVIIGGIVLLGVGGGVAFTRGTKHDAAAPAPVDAAEPPSATIDAMVVEVDAMAPPIDAAATRTPETLAQRIEREIAAANFAGVIAACDDAVSPDIAATCTIAACKRGAAPRAKKWLTLVPPGGRSAVVADCKRAGVDLAGKSRPVTTTPKDKGKTTECQKDPLACQH